LKQEELKTSGTLKLESYTTVMKLFWTCCAVLILTGICAESQKQVLQVVWMAPLRAPRHTNFVYNASSSVAALALGLQTIQRENILPNHDLK